MVRPTLSMVCACAAACAAPQKQPVLQGQGGPPADVATVYVSGGSDEIAVFTFDRTTGVLARKGSAATGGLRPGYLAFAPDRRFVYGVGGNPARVGSFAVDSATGMLTKIEGAEVPTGGSSGSPHIAVHPTGKWLVVAHFSSSQVSVVPLVQGIPGPAVQVLATAAEAHQVIIDPTGKWVFIPCRGGNAVEQLVFDGATGTLTPNDPARVEAQQPGAGPRHMFLHQNARWAYVINEKNGTVTSYRYDAGAGKLAEPQTIAAVPDGFAETASAHVLVHPNGRFLYGSNRIHNSIAIFSIDSATGRLVAVGHELGDGMIKAPRNFTIDPSGKFLLVANQRAGTVLVFRIDAGSGKLTRVGGPVEGLGGPSFVGVLH